jgi:hypothetical protein
MHDELTRTWLNEYRVKKIDVVHKTNNTCKMHIVQCTIYTCLKYTKGYVPLDKILNLK